MKFVEPSIHETAFSCPHCGAYTTQYWFRLYAKRTPSEHPTPPMPDEGHKKNVISDPEIPEDQREELIKWFDKMFSGFVFLDNSSSSSTSCNETVYNLNISKCYNCEKYAVWIHDRLVFPRNKVGVLPNPDLPDEVRRDFEEAREIVDASPRGAAALLRLSVQKLCIHLGEKGKNIDEDIGSLVKKGLNPLIQKTLDVVRVIGNEAVHPGIINLHDDRDTAMRLLSLVNAICDQMITHPKTVEEMYGKLPESKRKAIEKRDAKA